MSLPEECGARIARSSDSGGTAPQLWQNLDSRNWLFRPAFRGPTDLAAATAWGRDWLRPESHREIKDMSQIPPQNVSRSEPLTIMLEIIR